MWVQISLLCPIYQEVNISRVFLQRQIWIVNCHVRNFGRKSFSNINKQPVFPVHFGISIHVLSWRQQKQQCLLSLSTEIFWRTFWGNNWWSIFDVVERLCYWNKYWDKLKRFFYFSFPDDTIRKSCLKNKTGNKSSTSTVDSSKHVRIDIRNEHTMI